MKKKQYGLCTIKGGKVIVQWEGQDTSELQEWDKLMLHIEGKWIEAVLTMDEDGMDCFDTTSGWRLHDISGFPFLIRRVKPEEQTQ